jgi:uncharacterized small protein (DUF1192 family)
MDDDEPQMRVRPGGQGAAAHLLAGEDLGPLSQDELAHRIALLEAELARVRQHRERVAEHRASADALFGSKR